MHVEALLSPRRKQAGAGFKAATARCRTHELLVAFSTSAFIFIMSTARDAALVEFIGTFMTVSGSNIEKISDLGDGVALFEALSEM